ncbi:tyrosine-protein phosphatase [Sphingomonas immobilis]|uniref:Tyrosine-protein phosphatase n=1 Tax=Sphingomonas immobilis TaxID=3063997 RepID=A0ABT8ZY08_9SPHN|nr:tyrosine-protein phosphatase [Sphingomonas sp. CA1-15]MDO7842461.1 tyrosine-protein phosphatase [Sphingomonas sp. CA1-15]
MRVRRSGFGIVLAGLALLAGPGAAREATPRGAQAVAHQRVLPLEGGRNFRDLGGYPAGGGRHVVWGKLFRSGSMHGLTARDYAYLQTRGIVVVCDFRDTRERTAEPAAWPAGAAPRVLSDDYQLDMKQFFPAGDPKGWTAEQARVAMTASYPHMLGQFEGQYRRMFAELLAGHAPLAFNCSAGKDRSGVAAALLLTALGVPRETVISDYLLTNRYLDQNTMRASPASANSPLAQAPAGVREALGAADRRYIAAAFKVLDTYPGGARGWLKDKMGLSAADIARLRALYTA